MSLADLCILVRGRVPIIVEVKSHFDGDRRLVKRMAEVLKSYSGPVAGMSFDPDQVVALRETIPELPRGIVAQRDYTEADWPEATPSQRDGMRHLKHALAHPAAIRRLLGQRSAGARALDRAACVRPAALDLDGAHGRTARARCAAMPIK